MRIIEQDLQQEIENLQKENRRLQRELADRKSEVGKYTLDSLRKSEAEKRAILSAVPDLLFRLNRDGVFLDAHTGNPEILYIPADEFIGKRVDEVLPPDIAALALNSIEQALQLNEIITFEYDIPINGKIRYFENRVLAISDNETLSIIRDITSRKIAEQALQLQRKLAINLSGCSDLGTALSHTMDALLQLDGVTGCGIYQLNPKTGAPILLIHRGFSDSFLEAVQVYKPEPYQTKLILSGKPVYGEYHQVVSDKSFQGIRDEIISLAIVPIMHEGKPIGSINLASKSKNEFYLSIQSTLDAIAFQIGGVISRITAEKALLSSQLNFKKLFDTIDDFLIIVDMNGNIILTNKVVEKRLGYSIDELKGLHILELHPPERRDEAGLIIDDILAEKASFCPVPLMTSDGTQIPVETRLILGKWDERDVLYGISRDITERHVAEAALRMQSAAFESFAMAIIITDIAGKIRWANSGFCQLSGYALSEILDKKNSELVNSGIQDDTFYKNLWTTILSGNVWSGEIINRRKNGSLYPEELTITPVFDHLGAISGFIAIKIDITKRKAMERSMLESIEREKELNEMKSKFISLASHEFRTPLATIMATCESLLSYSDRMSNEQQEQRLKKIIAKVDQLNKIIEELLQLSKLQSKETQLQPEMFDLEALIRETILEFQNSPADSAPIHFDSVHEIINVYLDRKQIKVVISNLLSNAIKYTDATKQITIKLAKTNNIVSLTIADQGIGIPEADMKHLFEPFFRASNAVNLPGTGLGLNIVKEAVNRHHGQIIVKSKLNEGTDFQLILPNAI